MKDVPAKDFIEAFAKHLKKGNKIKIPDVSDYFQVVALALVILDVNSQIAILIIIYYSGLLTSRPPALGNFLLSTATGYTTALPPLPTRST